MIATKQRQRHTKEEIETIEFYIEKFKMKMAGRQEDIAKDWVEGINHHNKKVTKTIWENAKRYTVK